MRNNQQQFLNLRTLPARLQVEETAWYPGFAPHDISILVSRGLLKPLANPPPNGGKYFAAAVLVELRGDVNWLTRASNTIVGHWRSQNASQSKSFHAKSSSPRQRTDTSAKDNITFIKTTITKDRDALIRQEYDYVAGQCEILDGSPSCFWESEKLTDLNGVMVFKGLGGALQETCSH